MGNLENRNDINSSSKWHVVLIKSFFFYKWVILLFLIITHKSFYFLIKNRYMIMHDLKNLVPKFRCIFFSWLELFIKSNKNFSTHIKFLLFFVKNGFPLKVINFYYKLINYKFWGRNFQINPLEINLSTTRS